MIQNFFCTDGASCLVRNEEAVLMLSQISSAQLTVALKTLSSSIQAFFPASVVLEGDCCWLLAFDVGKWISS